MVRSVALVAGDPLGRLKARNTAGRKEPTCRRERTTVPHRGLGRTRAKRCVLDSFRPKLAPAVVLVYPVHVDA